MRDRLRLRFWMILNALLRIFYFLPSWREWGKFKLSVIKNEFFLPLRQGHIPGGVWDQILKNGFLAAPNRRFLSTGTIVSRMKDGLFFSQGRRYDEMPMLRGYLKAIYNHYNVCEHCQEASVIFYADLQKYQLDIKGKFAIGQ